VARPPLASRTTGWRTRLGQASGTHRDYAGQVGQHGISPSRLGTREGEKTGAAVAFSGELGALVAGKGVSDFM
jgi:hypothetical protein